MCEGVYSMAFPALTILPLSVTIIGAAFAIVIFNHYFSTRRRPHELMWGIAFLLFAVAAATQVYADVTGGWTPLLGRTYYLAGAVLNVGFLALGTIYLLFPRRVANLVFGIVLLLTLASTFIVFTVPVDAGALAIKGNVDWKAFFSVDTTPRWLAALFSGIGSIMVIAGALWSGLVFWRKGIMRQRMIGVFLLAAGTLIVGLGGTLKGALHSDDFLYPTMAVGVVIMFIGYLQTIRTSPAIQASTVQPAPERTPTSH